MLMDPLSWLFLIPGLLIAGMASAYTHAMFEKYKRVGASSRMTGARAAYRMLFDAGVRDVRIEQVSGFLSDHYDPTTRTLRLSPDVYSGTSLAAIGVACHEAGHALQHAEHYPPLALRGLMVPLTQFSSIASYILIPIGFLVFSRELILAGAVFFGVSVLFTLVTLPVEWDASARAKRLMVSRGIVSPAERDAAADVLNAAFLTYVASAVSALLTLLYYLIRSGALGGRRE